MWQFETEISEVINRTPGVKSFRFAKKGLKMPYRAGQFFYVTLKINGRKNVHHFSFSSSPTQTDYIEFTKRITDSGYSKALSEAHAGTWAEIEGPEGAFTLPVKTAKLAFLCGGIGITPVRSMLCYVKDKNLAHDCTLLFGNRNRDNIIFKAELEELELHDNIRIHHFLAEAETAGSGNMHQGLIDRDAIVRLIPDYPQRLFYLSGPPSMVEALYSQIQSLGLPSKQIKYDIFTGYR
ncbi:MAG: hypothetical protein JW954_06310 [Dehalococcoidaceae bacterium]|nr:hypothetical protein [Dehalococcoidaceae bacterium]